MIATSLLAKALWSAAIVLALSWIAERASTRVAGILSGAPIGTLLVYFFVGLEMGPAYVVASVPYGIAGFTGTIIFVLAYYVVSRHIERLQAVASTVVAVVLFAAVAMVLVRLPFTMAGALVLTIGSCVGAYWLLRKVENVHVDDPIRLTLGVLVLRGGSAALFVVAVIALAEALGSKWTGLLIGFPMTLLPTLFIVHVTYGEEYTHTMIRNFPLGLGSIVVYLLSVTVTFPMWGVYGGTAASLALSVVYLTLIALPGSDRRRRLRNPEPIDP